MIPSTIQAVLTSALFLLFLEAPRADSPHALLSENIRIAEATAEGMVLSWEFPPSSVEQSEQVLISVPHGTVGQPEVADYGVEPTTDAAEAPKVSIRTVGLMGDCRVASVNVPVYGYVPKAQERIRYVTGTVRIPWGSSEAISPKQEGPVEQILQTYLLNPATRFALPEKDESRMPMPDYRRVPSMRLSFTEEGPVRVGSDLWTRILPPGAKTTQIALFSEGRIVPYTIWSKAGEPKNEGPPEQGDEILFWARKSISPYSPKSVYWLCGLPGRTIPAEPDVRSGSAPLDSIRAVCRLEEDLDHFPEGKQNESQADYWVWKKLPDESGGTVCPDFAGLVSDATVSARLLQKRHFYKNSNEGFSFLVNGASLETTIEPGTAPFFTAAARIASASLLAGTNLLEIRTAPPDEKEYAIFLDRIEFEFDRYALYSGDPIRFQPKQDRYRIQSKALSGAVLWHILENGTVQSSRFLKPGVAIVTDASANEELVILDPRSVSYAKTYDFMPAVSPENHPLVPKGPVDIIIVTPRQFARKLLTLCADYRTRGFEPHLATLEEIDAIFGDGRMSPHNIKNYLTWVYRRTPDHRPSYVLLVGDATWDHWGRYKNGIANFLPAYRGEDDYPDENWFGCLTPGDTLPEMLVARYPIRSATDLDVMIDRNIHYPKTASQEWMNRVLLLTDNEFEDRMDEVSLTWLPLGYEVTEIRVADYSFRDNYYLPEDVRKELKSKTSPEATDAVIAGLNRGAVLWEFFGHGAPNVMTHERVFFAGGSKFSEAKRLTNKEMLTVFWGFTCQTGTFDYAQEKWNISIAEDLLTRPTGGAISVLAATGRGYPVDHSTLARGMHDAVFRHGMRNCCQAYAASCLIALAGRPSFEPQKQFCILGDPLFELPVPRRWPEEASLNVALDSSGSLKYRVESPVSDATASLWLRDSVFRPLWEDTITTKDWPAEGTMSLRDVCGPYWNEERHISFGATALTADGVIHGGTVIILPKPAVPQVGSGTPNLTILENEVTYRPSRPQNGMTVYFDIPVLNNGDASSPETNLNAQLEGIEGFAGEVRNLAGRSAPI
ncbi:MAG TPA: C25 family cysteine peptidase, partial [bacterium]|nr:C25 family cysteine peptidase [bacterium]